MDAMWWVLVTCNLAFATEFPVDTSGCVWDGAPPDTDGDGLEDDFELRYLQEDDLDTDEDGCPDVNDPDDDGDGLPTFDEDLDRDGNWLNDTERISPSSFPGAWLDDNDPFDNDGDDWLDARWGGDDCEDSYAAMFPGAPERWYDGRDGDCDGGSDFDQDGDGFDAESSSAQGPDCDDLDPTVHPDAEEDAGPVDRDCDGFSDPRHELLPTGGCACAGAGEPLGALVSLVVAAVSSRGRRRR
jgi:hypothetical protein